MCKGYILEWLETMIYVRLNPSKSETILFSSEDLATLQSLIKREKNRIELSIKAAIFNQNDRKAIKCVIENYHLSLISLLDQALENIVQLDKNSIPEKILSSIIITIEDLLNLIERRFINYLGINERVSANYLVELRKKLLDRIVLVLRKYREYQQFIPVLDIIVGEIEVFLNLSSDKHTHTFKELTYIKDLCLVLESFEVGEKMTLYTALDEALIQMNFNSKVYILNLTQRIATSMNDVQQPLERMEYLLFGLKSFKQLQIRPDVVLFSKQSFLHTQVKRWFSQEIAYLEKKVHNTIISSRENDEKPDVKSRKKDKLLSRLSVDQMALILRAADELKIIMARSLNSVFKNIGPFLSTPFQEDISYDSMRSKSYAAEIRDKEIVTQTLQEMIKKINEY